MEGHDTSKENNRVKEVLEAVGLAGFEKKKVYQCSGGEQQRVAIARLMLKPCELILADEPTGSLDHENKMKVVDLLKGFQRAGKTVVLVTHDEVLMHLGEPLIRIDQVP